MIAGLLVISFGRSGRCRNHVVKSLPDLLKLTGKGW